MIRLSLSPGQRVSVGRAMVTFMGKTPWGALRFLMEAPGAEPKAHDMRDDETREIPGVSGGLLIMVRRKRGGKAVPIGLELPDKVVATLLKEPCPRLRGDGLRCQGLSI